MNTDVGTRPDRRHRLSFGEDLRVGPDPDLEVLRPDALRNERVLHRLRLRRARTNIPQVVSHDGDDRLPHRFRLAGIASRLFFDDPFEEARHEGHAAGLDRLEIAWREQPRRTRVAMLFIRIAQRVTKRSDPRQSLCRTNRPDGIRQLEQLAAGRRPARQIVQLVLMIPDDRRSFDIAPPHTATRTALEW